MQGTKINSLLVEKHKKKKKKKKNFCPILTFFGRGVGVGIALLFFSL